MVTSAFIVVLPSTQLFNAFCAFLASCPLLYLTRAMPCVRYRWKFCRGPCCMHKVLRVEPSICAVRFLRSSQEGPVDGPLPPLDQLECVELSPFVGQADVALVEVMFVAIVFAAWPLDCPQRSCPMAVRLVTLED